MVRVAQVSVEQQLARLSEHMGHDAMQQGPTIVKGTRDGLVKVYAREGQCAAKHSPESIKAFKAMADDLRAQRDSDPDGALCWSRIRRARKSREAVKIKRCYVEGKEAVRTEAENYDAAESLVEKLEELQAPGVLVLHHYNLDELNIMWVQVGERFMQVTVSGAAAKRIRQTGTRRSLTLMPIINAGSTRAFVWIAKKDTVDTFMQWKKEHAQAFDHMCAEARAGRTGLWTAEAAAADDSAAASSSSSEASRDIAAELAAAAPSAAAGLSAPASSSGAAAGGGARGNGAWSARAEPLAPATSVSADDEVRALLEGGTPPAALLPGPRILQEMSTSGALHLFYATKSGFMESHIFFDVVRRWCEFEMKLDAAWKDERKILVMDNHGAHLFSPALWALQHYNVQSLFLPGHSTHLWQPLDVCTNGIFRKAFKAARVRVETLRATGVVVKSKGWAKMMDATIIPGADEFCDSAMDRVKLVAVDDGDDESLTVRLDDAKCTLGRSLQDHDSVATAWLAWEYSVGRSRAALSGGFLRSGILSKQSIDFADGHGACDRLRIVQRVDDEGTPPSSSAVREGAMAGALEARSAPSLRSARGEVLSPNSKRLVSRDAAALAVIADRGFAHGAGGPHRAGRRVGKARTSVEILCKHEMAQAADEHREAEAKAKQREKEAKKAAKVREQEERQAAKSREQEERRAAKVREQEERQAAKIRELEERQAAKIREQEERRAAKLREQEERRAAKIRAQQERQAKRVRAAEGDADGFGVGARERLGRLVQGVRLILAGKRPSSRLLSGVGLTEAEVARMGRVKRSRDGDKLYVWWDPEDMGRHNAVAEEAEASAVPSVPGANGDTAPGDAPAKRARRAERRA